MPEGNKPFAIRQARKDLADAQQTLEDLQKQGTKGPALDDAKQAVRDAKRALENLTSGSRDDRLDARREYMDKFFDELGGPWIAELYKRDPELRGLIETAIQNGWTPDNFLFGADGKPGLYESNWWNDPKRSASWKQAFQWEFAADKTTWDSKLELAKRTIRDAAKSMYGINVSETDLDRLARRYWYNGWGEFDNEGLKVWLSTVFKKGSIGDPNEDGSTFQPGGQLLDTERTLRDAVRQNGLYRTDDWYRKTAENILNPQSGYNADNAWNELIQEAEGLYPVFAGKISKDRSVRDLAGGYIGQLARYLEINDPNMIDLTDPLLQKAFTNLDQNNNPALMPLWQFTQEVKKDARWQYTTNALDTYSSIGSDLARMMGFVR